MAKEQSTSTAFRELINRSTDEQVDDILSLLAFASFPIREGQEEYLQDCQREVKADEWLWDQLGFEPLHDNDGGLMGYTKNK